MKHLLIVGIVGLLAGCATPSAVIKDKPLKPGEHARVDVAVAAQGIEGEYTQLSRAQVRQQNGQVLDTTQMYHGRTQAGRIAEGVTAGMGAAAINGIAGYAIAKEGACNSKNCGTQISVAGAPAIATAGSSSSSKAKLDATSGQCGAGQPCAAYQ